EDITSRLVSPDQYQAALDSGDIPVLIDPQASILNNPLLTSPHSTIVIDARMIKRTPEPLDAKVSFHIGLGPGFVAGENCNAVIETQRGHTLGRVYWSGSTLPDSGEPEGDRRRVLRAPCDGILTSDLKIGDPLEESQKIAQIEPEDGGEPFRIISPFKGILRGLIRPGLRVTRDMKIGDVDRRNVPAMYSLVSDKALAVGGGVLEALLVFMRETNT
ncbi:MAG: molybdenum hydroxylase, partial [Chloroflexi bacterium]|nr:molybdenum hydroxylase [Chloroflexota bacterium]